MVNLKMNWGRGMSRIGNVLMQDLTSRTAFVRAMSNVWPDPAGLNLIPIAMLICLGLFFTSAVLAFDETRAKKYADCVEEQRNIGLKGDESRAFIKNCLSNNVDVPTGSKSAEGGAASLPSPGLRGGDFSCGGAKVEFKFFKSSIEKNGVESVMTVSRGERSTILRYDMNIDFIGGICVPNGRQEPSIVFQVYCGGSGCYDLDNWGIIDPSDLRVLLVPNTWNRKDARMILGRDLPKVEMIPIANEAEKLKH